jgi:hypothetical protein
MAGTMTRISLWQPAGTFDVPGKGEFPQVFAPGSWDSQIGKQVPCRLGGDETVLCTLVAAEVVQNGSGVMLTIELPGSSGLELPLAPGDMSFAFRESDPDAMSRDPLDVKPPQISWKTP